MSRKTTPVLDRILARCDEIGECLVYACDQSNPRTHIRVKDDAGNNTTLGRAYWLATGGVIPEKWTIIHTCGDNRCVNHLATRTLGAAMRIAAKKGAYSSPARLEKRMATQRERSQFNDAVIEDVRTSTSARAAAEKHGMSLSYAKAIRKGVARRPLRAGNPFAGLGAR